MHLPFIFVQQIYYAAFLCVFHLESDVSIGDGSVSNLNDNLGQSYTTSDSGTFPFCYYLVIAKEALGEVPCEWAKAKPSGGLSFTVNSSSLYLDARLTLTLL